MRPQKWQGATFAMLAMYLVHTPEVTGLQSNAPPDVVSRGALLRAGALLPLGALLNRQREHSQQPAWQRPEVSRDSSAVA